MGEIEPALPEDENCHKTSEGMMMMMMMRKENNNSGSNESRAVASDLSFKEDVNFHDLWEDECMRYLAREPDFRARLQYEVRVIAISPLFEVKGRHVSTFVSLYEKTFGKKIEDSGFSNAARLCRAMPHVVERVILSEQRRIHLVDSSKNHRVVAGIRSGLRRIVYDVLVQHPGGLGFSEMEEECSRLLMEPLCKILTDHGYHSPNVECMLTDMPDIAYISELGLENRVYLSKRAEDPAFTDGLLLGRADKRLLPLREGKHCVVNEEEKTADTKYNHQQWSSYSAAPPQADMASDVTEDARIGPGGMCLEELADLQVLRASELQMSEVCDDDFPWSGEDVARQVRLRLRLLLALHNEGQGAELLKISEIYEKMFSTTLDLNAMGFSSIEALVQCWEDIFLQRSHLPGHVFPAETHENWRVVNTVTTGLRSAVFAILLARYPEGPDPFELVQCLEQTLSGKLSDMFKANGYLYDLDATTQGLLCGRGSEFQLADCAELQMLLHDMDDFVRLGCREDGSLVVKLRDGEFPLLDLLDCNVGDGTCSDNEVESKDLTSLKPCDVKLSISGLKTSSQSQSQSLQIGSWANKLSNTAACNSNSNLLNPSPSPKIKHELRLILGSDNYIGNGLPVAEFFKVYKKRKGHTLPLEGYENLKAVVLAMPEVIDQTAFAATDCLKLVQSAKNLRVLSVTKAGLRQVLFWVLLKNPSGIWAELLEGWYLDFAGGTLSSTLTRHGYEKSRHSALLPVFQFLHDMADVLKIHPKNPHIYMWAEEVEDPVLSDSPLLGLLPEMIQYDCLREDYENSRSKSNLSLHLATAGIQPYQGLDAGGSSNVCHKEDDCHSSSSEVSTDLGEMWKNRHNSASS